MDELDSYWWCSGCGAVRLDEDIRVDDECLGCACRFALVLIGEDID